MWLIFITFLAVLFSGSCSNENELIDQNGGIKTQFTDLNDDVLYIIFNDLKLNDLQNLAQLNSRFADIAYEVVRRKYRHFRLEISIKSSEPQFDEDQNKYTIYDIQMALNVLKYFGNCFQVLKFD